MEGGRRRRGERESGEKFRKKGQEEREGRMQVRMRGREERVRRGRGEDRAGGRNDKEERDGE